MPIIIPSPQPWAVASDLAAYLQRDIDDAQGDQVLRLAASAVKAELRWDPIASQRTLSLPRVWPGRVVALPVPPGTLGDVSVAVAGQDLPVGSWWLNSEAGSLVFLAFVQAVTVTYAAGWAVDDLPEAIVSSYFDEAVRRLDNPRGLKRFEWTVGSEQESSFYGTDGSALSVDGRLDPYRLLPGVG